MNFIASLTYRMNTLSSQRKFRMLLLTVILFVGGVIIWEYYQSLQHEQEIRELRHTYQLLKQEFRVLMKACASK